MSSISSSRMRPNNPLGTGTIRRYSPRFAIAVAAFAIAFAVDVATDRRFSMYLGSAAILVSLLAIFTWARRLAIPAGAYIGVWVGFNAMRAVADAVPWDDRTLELVARLESTLLAGALLSARLQDWLFNASATGVLDVVATAVYLSYFIVPHVVGLWLFVRWRDRFWRYVTSTSLVFLIGIVGFAALPTAPPWQAAGDEVRRIVHVLHAGDGSSPAYAFDPNPVASMPSIHLAVTVLLVPLAMRHAWRIAALVYAVAMGFALVYLGEHYLLDVVIGALVAMAAWRVSGSIQDAASRLLTRRRSEHRMREAARLNGGKRGMNVSYMRRP